MASKLGQTIAEADARLVRVIGNRNVPGFKLFRSWPHLAAAAATGSQVGSLIEAHIANATGTITDPKANGNTYDGTFVYSKVEARDEDIEGTSDRAAVIHEELTKVTSIASSSDLANPFIRQNNLIVFPLRAETGETDQIVLTYININPASRQVCMETVSDAQLKAIADALVTGTPWTYVERDFKEQDDKTAHFVVTLADYNSDATSNDGTDSILEEIQNAVGGNRRALNMQTKEKVPASIADTIMSDGTGWDIPSGYSLLTLRRRNHADGTATVFQVSIKAVTWTFNTNADDVFQIIFWGNRTLRVKENEEPKHRKFVEHTEAFYTNTQARAEAWAGGTDVSAEAWANDSYMDEQGEATAAAYVKGHLTQAIRGDYRWIAYRTSKLEEFGQVVQAETAP